MMRTRTRMRVILTEEGWNNLYVARSYIFILNALASYKKAWTPVLFYRISSLKDSLTSLKESTPSLKESLTSLKESASYKKERKFSLKETASSLKDSWSTLLVRMPMLFVSKVLPFSREFL